MNVATPNIPTPWASSWTYTKTWARKYHFSLQVKGREKALVASWRKQAVLNRWPDRAMILLSLSP
jgi:hypothetical protein